MIFLRLLSCLIRGFITESHHARHCQLRSTTRSRGQIRCGQPCLVGFPIRRRSVLGPRGSGVPDWVDARVYRPNIAFGVQGWAAVAPASGTLMERELYMFSSSFSSCSFFSSFSLVEFFFLFLFPFLSSFLFFPVAPFCFFHRPSFSSFFFFKKKCPFGCRFSSRFFFSIIFDGFVPSASLSVIK